MPGARLNRAEQPPEDDRRNHYRVLHVQPEAPLAIIKASYRALMTSLRMHPDLGGSHAQAAAINAAWAVLSDPVRRAAYDRLLRRLGHLAPRAPAASGAAATRAAAPSAGAGRPAGPPPSAAPPAAPSAPSAAPAAAAAAPAPAAPPSAAPQPQPQPQPSGAAVLARAEGTAPRRQCALCAQPCGATVPADGRCLRCHAPLAALPLPGSPGHELLGRRGAARRGKDQVALLHVGWPSPGLPVRWRDLSLTGLSFYAPQALPPGQRIHLVDQALEAVAEVVASRRQGLLFTVHARLLTLLRQQPTGVFMSASA